ncbi:hypothetical protein TNCV_5043561 [Trichonephila clavipes]|uniref:Uncharacterized protein n=1 Tax=Trichonephila clavipes TaxID=2585209 RepID=A0A8X6RCT7_TRICX|nr:hypothetical protein TNCV_5043561 [Trichonephila clavipes]
MEETLESPKLFVALLRLSSYRSRDICVPNILVNKYILLALESLTNYSVVPANISSQCSSHCWRSPLPQASALIQRDFGCVHGVQLAKQLPHIAKVDLVWHLEV